MNKNTTKLNIILIELPPPTMPVLCNFVLWSTTVELTDGGAKVEH